MLSNDCTRSPAAALGAAAAGAATAAAAPAAACTGSACRASSHRHHWRRCFCAGHAACHGAAAALPFCRRPLSPAAVRCRRRHGCGRAERQRRRQRCQGQQRLSLSVRLASAAARVRNRRRTAGGRPPAAHRRAVVPHHLTVLHGAAPTLRQLQVARCANCRRRPAGQPCLCDTRFVLQIKRLQRASWSRRSQRGSAA